MTVIIGIDPHKALHAAFAIDDKEVERAQLEVRAGRRQLEQLLGWAEPFAPRLWAIESAGGLGDLLAQQLVGAGERVVDVPATLSSRVRVLGTGRSNKNDTNDARAVAIAALRAPALAAVRSEDHVTVLRLLAKTHPDAGRARSRACSRLHALVGELIAGGIRKEVVVSQTETLLAGIDPSGVAQAQRLELAHELLDEIRVLDAKLKRSKQRITNAVTASNTTLTELYGVGPIITAIVVGYTGDVCRFATAGHYAAYNGTAPIELSSGGRIVHRLSRRGNRTLNHAIHMIAVTQMRKGRSRGLLLPRSSRVWGRRAACLGCRAPPRQETAAVSLDVGVRHVASKRALVVDTRGPHREAPAPSLAVTYHCGGDAVALVAWGWRWDSPYNRPFRADGPYSGLSRHRGGAAVSEDRDEAVADALHVPVRRRPFGGRAEPSVLFFIAIGGGLGTLARYGLSRVIHVSKDTFPWATFTTNLVGAFVLGLFLTLIIERFPPTRFPRPFFAIGFLGGFTTFSTMAVETVTLCKDGYPVLGIGYLLASVCFGLAACYVGIVLARLSPFGADTAPR